MMAGSHLSLFSSHHRIRGKDIRRITGKTQSERYFVQKRGETDETGHFTPLLLTGRSPGSSPNGGTEQVIKLTKTVVGPLAPFFFIS